MGGSDDPTNLIEVSVEEHSELHLALYLEYGRTEDWVASQSLAGLMGKEEARRLATASSNINRVWTKEMRDNAARGSQGNSNSKGHSPNEEIRKVWSVKRKGRRWYNDGTNETLSFEQPGPEWVRGRIKLDWLQRGSDGRYLNTGI